MSAGLSPLGTRILAGDDRELRLLAARGLLPIHPEELIPIQVALARGDDPDLAAEATGSLRALTPRLANAYLERTAGAGELTYFALEIGHPRQVEVILRRRDVPLPLLVELAPRLSEDLQEMLLLRQDAVIEEPAILDALEKNPRLSSFARRRIGEYREHLLPRRRRLERGDEEGDLEEASDDEVSAAVAEVKSKRQAAPEETETALGLSESEIRALPIKVRLRLARGASRTLRSIMLRDPNPNVALHVLRTSALSDSEIEQIAHSRTVVEEILEYIVNDRGWIRKYPILKAVVANPRTPVGAAVRLLSRLAVRDLKALSRDRNAAQAVRDTAARLYRIKRR